MNFRSLLGRLLAVLCTVSITFTSYLYLYPVFHQCAFPFPRSRNHSTIFSSLPSQPFVNTFLRHVAPDFALRQRDIPAPALFRLLILADPQLEGDSSLPDPDDAFIPRLRRHWASIKATELPSSRHSYGHFFAIIRSVVWTLARDDIPFAFRAARKRLDLLGNDYYLAHIYRTLYWWSRPTHVVVLGDLLGSQWMTDGEFEKRGSRYWNRVFQGAERVRDDEIGIIAPGSGKGHPEGEEGERSGSDELEILRRYDSPWARKLINVAGNHDIGYSGDVSPARLERFQRVFGQPQWDVRFRAGADDDSEGGGDSASSAVTPTLHLINLNSLTLDSPPLFPELQAEGYDYINDLISQRSYSVEDRTSFTLLLTHVPLHKREGICTDSPHFAFHDVDDPESQTPRFKRGGLKEQNLLSEHISTNGILQGIFGLSGDENVPGQGRGRNGLILTGHDHAGCDVIHFINRSSSSESEQPWHWDSRRYTSSSSSPPSSLPPASEPPSIREITLRSMMGEYGGNAGLLSLWFDSDPAVNEWRYEISMCAAGVQHIWWAVHLTTCLALVFFGVAFGRFIFPRRRNLTPSSPQIRESEIKARERRK